MTTLGLSSLKGAQRNMEWSEDQIWNYVNLQPGDDDDDAFASAIASYHVRLSQRIGVDVLELLFWKRKIACLHGDPWRLPRQDQFRYVAFHDTCVQMGLKPVMTYQEVLRSFPFRFKRALVLSRADGRCALNRFHRARDVHHNTYERLGCERLEDLIQLCRPCHEHHHDKLPKPPTVVDRWLPFAGSLARTNDN